MSKTGFVYLDEVMKNARGFAPGELVVLYGAPRPYGPKSLLSFHWYLERLSKMKEFTIYSNWGYWDYLDGKELKDGEEIEVVWSDGTIERLKVTVLPSSLKTMDHGHEVELPVREAFATIYYHGAKALIRLGGSGLKGRRV